MEKILQPYDKEFMKMSILKHEEIFKEQVYELHRLYQIQKIMMKSSISKIRPKGPKQEGWNLNNVNNFGQFNPESKLDLEQPAGEEYIADLDGDDGVLEIIDESEIELTLGPTRYGNNNNNSSSNRRKRPEAPLASDYSGPSFSSSSTGSSHVNKTNNSRTHQRKHLQVPSGTSDKIGTIQRKQGHFPDVASGFYRSESKNSNSNIGDVVDEQLRQDERLNLPPWLFQVLSLNMT